MTRLSKMLGSTVGKKYIVGLTGVALLGFVVFHLLGNLNLFKGEEALNNYGRTLESLPGAAFGELAIAALILLHIGMTMSLARDNAKARPENYEQLKARTSFASSWMVVSGGIIALFLVVHLVGIRFGDRGEHMENLYDLTMEQLRTPWKSALYIAGVSLLFFHMSHGIQAVFRTLGLSSPEHLEKLAPVAKGISLILALGFIAMPIYALVTQ